MGAITFAELVARVKAQNFPEGEPANLVAPHRAFIVDALKRIQKYCPYYQQNHKDIWPFCSTHFNCGMTVVDAPRGTVLAVYTLPANLDCCEIEYRHEPSGLEQLKHYTSIWTPRWDDPPNKGLPSLQPGFKFSESVTDKPFGRAGYGMFVVHNQRLYVSPRIESTERLVVEWDGMKETWADSDEVVDTDDEEFVKCVALHQLYEHCWRYGQDTQQTQLTLMNRADALAELIYSAKLYEAIAVKEPKGFPPTRMVNCAYCQPGECRAAVTSDFGGVDAVEGEAVAGFVGDIYASGAFTNALAVEALIEGWTPDIVLFGGDVRNGDISYQDLFAELDYYDSLIGETIDANRLWPAIGNHDWSDNNGLFGWLEYFALPNNERFYDFVHGAVHYFVVCSQTEEPEGITAGSPQAEWLKLKLASSNATWKVVMLHKSPFTSGSDHYPGTTALRWPFAAWGADLVLSGHDHVYERINTGGLDYICCGLGGASLDTFNTPVVDGSQYRYADGFGAVRIVSGCNRLVCEFYPVGATTPLDTLTLTK